MPTKGQETRKHILRESRRLFTVQGFENTSISQIITATGVKKGNLYYHFISKEALGLAVLADARDDFFVLLDNSLTGEDSVSRILNSCYGIMELMQQNKFAGGCLFGNTALEMTDSNSSFGSIIQEVFSRWIERIEQELKRAVRNDSQQFSLPPLTLAIAVVAILEGGIMLSRVYQNKNSLEQCLLTIRSLLVAQD